MVSINQVGGKFIGAELICLLDLSHTRRYFRLRLVVLLHLLALLGDLLRPLALGLLLVLLLALLDLLVRMRRITLSFDLCEQMTFLLGKEWVFEDLEIAGLVLKLVEVVHIELPDK